MLVGPVPLLVLLAWLDFVMFLLVSAVALVARFPEIIGRLSLSSDFYSLFSNRRPVRFRCCFSASAFFVARSFTSGGFSGAR